MSEEEYICLSSGRTVAQPNECPDCKRKSCPTCGGDVDTVDEYNEAMKVNSK